MQAAASIDEYLAGVPAEKRAELERIRAIVHDEVPDEVESINYAMPAFRLDGHYLLGFSARKSGCSFHPGRLPVEMVEGELAAYQVWKGTINYDCHRPIPEDLVRRIVRRRVAHLRS
jgi:uncharacterized protein YdhG (YjbR/CyaY superfamily)